MAEVGYFLKRAFVRKEHEVGGMIRFQGKGDLSEPKVFMATADGETVGSGTMTVSDRILMPFQLRFENAGMQNLEIIVSASDVIGATWSQVFQSPIQVLDMPEFAPLVVQAEPVEAVEGEEVELRMHLKCVGSVTGTLESAEMTLFREGMEGSKKIAIWKEKRLLLPH